MSHGKKDKQKDLNLYSKDKSCRTSYISAPCCTSVGSKKGTEEHFSAPQMVKRLKTRKQRNEIRGLNCGSRQQGKRGSKEKVHFHNHNQHCYCALNYKKRRVLTKAVPPKKPSIITEGRLTSIRGLFSHEVRSVDIERLAQENTQRHEQQKVLQEQAIPSSSPILPSPPSIMSQPESGESDVSECLEDDQKSMISRNKVLSLQRDQLQANSEGTHPRSVPRRNLMQNVEAVCHETVDNFARPGSLSDQKGTESVLLSSAQSEPIHKSSSASAKAFQNDSNVSVEMQDTLESHHHEQTQRDTRSMQPGFPKSQRLDKTPKPVLLNTDAVLSDGDTMRASPPALDRIKSPLRGKGQHIKPAVSTGSETIGRLATRLCQTLDFLPQPRSRPMLTECREVLLEALQERQHQPRWHKLDSNLSAEQPCLPYIPNHSRCSSEPRSGDFTQIYRGSRKNDCKHSRNMEIQADNSSHRERCVAEDDCHDIGKEATFKRGQQQPRGTYSAQDFPSKLYRPCQDMLDQWSITLHSQRSPRAKQHSSSQSISLQNSYTAPEIPTLCSYNWADLTSDPLFLQPQKQAEPHNRVREGAELLEQWRNDPDLDFLFHSGNKGATHTPLRPLMELPDHQLKGITERPFVASSSAAAVFPPEGFRYEPYYRFPHPSKSVYRSERSSTTLNDQTDTKEMHASHPLQMTFPFL